MNVIPIPCLSDNYSYLIVCEESNQAGIVDPSEFAPVWEVIQREGVNLVAILNTHHHWDHVGGNEELQKKIPGLKVYGHHSDKGRVPGQNVMLQDTDKIKIGNLEGHLTHNPGHTSGAISFYFEDSVFTGDTMFAGGCGRLFEGTPQDMYQSLNEKIGHHSPATKVYFGHEYTENNLKFALSVEPENKWVQEKLAETIKLRKSGKFTTPSTLESEFQTNPFMRCDSPEIQKTVQNRDPGNDLSPSSILAVIRKMKDDF
ncbi:MAG: hydroxyacylglutathione hydrolase [SAR324 cluster bacterium]|nr:hydroxyacylglutathione hydrolase [SAR324 cluster bacterium]